MADSKNIIAFVRRRKVAFLGSVDENGFPNIKAMLAPRMIVNGKEFYFSTNTSSVRVAHYRISSKASVYFCRKGLIRYEGVQFTGKMEVLEDEAIKKQLWQVGDSIYYPKGVTDPDYCVLKFTAQAGRYYCNLKTESFSLE